jgi:hypothetical protein
MYRSWMNIGDLVGQASRKNDYENSEYKKDSSFKT